MTTTREGFTADWTHTTPAETAARHLAMLYKATIGAAIPCSWLREAQQAPPAIASRILALTVDGFRRAHQLIATSPRRRKWCLTAMLEVANPPTETPTRKTRAADTVAAAQARIAEANREAAQLSKRDAVEAADRYAMAVEYFQGLPDETRIAYLERARTAPFAPLHRPDVLETQAAIAAWNDGGQELQR